MKNNETTSLAFELVGAIVVFIINLAATVGGIWFLIEKLF